MSKKCFFMGVGLIACIGLSCGIFTPNQVEKPAGEMFSDPFRLYSILENTGEQFSKTGYEDIFDENFKFIAWDNASYNKETMIEQLKTLKASDSISTVWDTCGGVGEIREGNTLTLCRTYYLTYFRPSGNVSDTGKINFTLNRSQGSIWTIMVWEEGVARSIFHP